MRLDDPQDEMAAAEIDALAVRQDAVRVALASKVAPLRRIVRVQDGEWIRREHLECGHTQDGGPTFAQRRRCKQCLEHPFDCGHCGSYFDPVGLRCDFCNRGRTGDPT